MKPDTQVKNYQSTVTGDAVKMSIDESATAHIMDVLTKLYADPEKAIIREYATNALDSHIEAGVKRPIEVTLPTPLAPFLTIRDYGIGLDADGIRDIYSRYGTSTKRGSNEAVGMLGLGCKSALSYTDQFTLTGFKDGYRTEVLISRDEDGAGSMTIVDEGLDENYLGNGVQVTIPVKRENDVAEKANDFFRYWDSGTVLVNGKAPTRIGKDAGADWEDNDSFWLSDDILLTTAVDESIVVMGNVPYPLTDGTETLFSVGNGRQRRYNTYNSSWNAVCFVPIGTVNFAPSREQLMDTKRTRAALKSLRERIMNLRDDEVRKQVAAAPTAADAQQLLRKGMAIGFKQDDPNDPHAQPATWKGQAVVLQLERRPPLHDNGYRKLLDLQADVAYLSKYSYLQINSGYYARKSGERVHDINLSHPATIFHGWDGKVMTNVKRAKLEIYCQNENLSTGTHFIFTDSLTAHEKFWLDGWDVRDWKDVAAIELPKTTMPDGTTTRLKGSYDILNAGSFESGVSADKLAKLKLPIYWFAGRTADGRYRPAVHGGAVKTSSCVIVGLARNRIDKFCRDFPKAIDLETAAKQAAERWSKKQDTEQIKAFAVQENLDAADTLKLLDFTRINDPALAETIRLCQVDITKYESERNAYSRYVSIKDSDASYYRKVVAKYPLLQSDRNIYYRRVTDEQIAHLYIYLNAAFAQQKGV